MKSYMSILILLLTVMTPLAYATNFTNKRACILEVMQNEESLRIFCDGQLIQKTTVERKAENLKLTEILAEALDSGMKLISCSERPFFNNYAVRTCVLTKP